MCNISLSVCSPVSACLTKASDAILAAAAAGCCHQVHLRAVVYSAGEEDLVGEVQSGICSMREAL